MKHFHGGPITPLEVARHVWKGRHAFVSFEHPEQVGFAQTLCQSYALDSGAFTAWTQGRKVDFPAFLEWVREWGRFPGCDFALIPDVIDGDEAENDELLAWWDAQRTPCLGVPVWHLHESLDRLHSLCAEYQLVALGSSGQWKDPGSGPWWQRMGEVMDAICDEDGYPPAKLHGLRMLNNTITSQIPLASADSTNVAQNHNRFRRSHGLTSLMAAIEMVGNIEAHPTASRWSRLFGHQENMDLVG